MHVAQWLSASCRAYPEPWVQSSVKQRGVGNKELEKASCGNMLSVLWKDCGRNLTHCSQCWKTVSSFTFKFRTLFPLVEGEAVCIIGLETCFISLYQRVGRVELAKRKILVCLACYE